MTWQRDRGSERFFSLLSSFSLPPRSLHCGPPDGAVVTPAGSSVPMPSNDRTEWSIHPAPRPEPTRSPAGSRGSSQAADVCGGPCRRVGGGFWLGVIIFTWRDDAQQVASMQEHGMVTFEIGARVSFLGELTKLLLLAWARCAATLKQQHRRVRARCAQSRCLEKNASRDASFYCHALPAPRWQLCGW